MRTYVVHSTYYVKYLKVILNLFVIVSNKNIVFLLICDAIIVKQM